MNEELEVVSGAIDSLVSRILGSGSLEEIHQPLRALQRLGLTRADLRVHLERLRVQNDLTQQSYDVEDRAVDALDMVAGIAGDMSLRWDPQEVASIAIAKCLTAESLKVGIENALRPNDLLPPRAESDLDQDALRQVALAQLDSVRSYAAIPAEADFFRVPKAGFTSRPAALLSPQDRITYEALGVIISEALRAAMSPAVAWPSAGLERESHHAFVTAPQRWEASYIVVTDIESYYESIDHSLLVSFAHGKLGIRGEYLQALEAFLDSVMGSNVGLPQGPPASELFGALYLLPIDDEIFARGWEYQRYADDILIGASTVVEARRRLEMVEAAMRPMGLRLNSRKTRVMRRETYLKGLNQPSTRVESFRKRIRKITEDTLRETEDAEELESMLVQYGVDEAIIWDLLYHHTATIDEVILEFRNQLAPSLVESYGKYFERLAKRLRRDSLPEDMQAAEMDLRECLTYLASARSAVDLDLVDQSVKWFPRLTPYASAYLQEIARSRPRIVREHLKSWLNEASSDTDWSVAWFVHVAESAPRVVDKEFADLLGEICLSPSGYGDLTRSSAVRALAAARRLTPEVWGAVFGSVTPAIRSELALAAWADPERYKGQSSSEVPIIGELGPRSR